jgi:uncharacterized protein (TIGR00725 family)
MGQLGDVTFVGGLMNMGITDGRAPYIAVIGPSEASDEEKVLAYAVGREIALRGGVLVCGGRGGVMEAAARGAREAPADPPAKAVGILPGSDRAAGNDYLTIIVATGMGELRNGILITSSDAVVVVGGNAGTLIEMAYALQAGKPIAVLNGWSILDDSGQPVRGITASSTAAQAVAAVLDEL